MDAVTRPSILLASPTHPKGLGVDATPSQGTIAVPALAPAHQVLQRLLAAVRSSDCGLISLRHSGLASLLRMPGLKLASTLVELGHELNTSFLGRLVNSRIGARLGRRANSLEEACRVATFPALDHALDLGDRVGLADLQ